MFLIPSLYTYDKEGAAMKNVIVEMILVAYILKTVLFYVTISDNKK